MRRFGRKNTGGLLLLAAAAVLLGPSAGAQEPASAPSQTGQAPAGQTAPGGRRGQFAAMQRAAGEVTAVSGGTVTVRSEDGSTVQVVTTDNTRVMKDRGPAKLSDLHAGDGVMAMGNMDTATHTLHAAFVVATDAAQLKALRENLGKTYIVGRVTAVDLDNARMTVEREDHVAQTIGFDESTSFKRAVRGPRSGGAAAGEPRSGTGAGEASGTGGRMAGRGYGGGMGGAMGMGDPTAALERGFANGESITLADIKVGDFVTATGSVKNGVFVPTHLLDSPPGQRRQRPGEAPAAGAGTGTAGPGAQPGGTGPGER